MSCCRAIPSGSSGNPVSGRGSAARPTGATATATAQDAWVLTAVTLSFAFPFHVVCGKGSPVVEMLMKKKPSPSEAAPVSIPALKRDWHVPCWQKAPHRLPGMLLKVVPSRGQGQQQSEDVHGFRTRRPEFPFAP